MPSTSLPPLCNGNVAAEHTAIMYGYVCVRACENVELYPTYCSNTNSQCNYVRKKKSLLRSSLSTRNFLAIIALVQDTERHDIAEFYQTHMPLTRHRWMTAPEDNEVFCFGVCLVSSINETQDSFGDLLVNV